jgi:N-acetylmuramoyl-L-alanine amidase
MSEPLLTTRQDIMPAGRTVNKPGVTLNGAKADWITVHETANPNPGANAAMHDRFVHDGGGADHVSFHATQDDRENIQILSWYEAAYHAADGGGPGNYDSIAIETCINSDGNWEQTKRNLAELIKRLMREFGIPATKVVQHNHWSGKDCPRRLRSNGGKEWAELMAAIGAQSDPENRLDPVTGFYISHGFLVEYKRLEGLGIAMQLLGRPIGAEKQETIGGWSGTVQYFERGRMEWHTEGGQGVVLYGLVGQELLTERAA